MQLKTKEALPVGATAITAINSIYGKYIGRLYENFTWIKIKVIAWFVVIFGINTTRDISELFYISPQASEIWGNFEISQVVNMPNITYNSFYYLFLLQPEKFSHLNPCVYFRRVVLPRRENWFEVLDFDPAGPDTEPEVNVLFSVFWFSEFSFQFLNLLISKSRLNLSAIFV